MGSVFSRNRRPAPQPEPDDERPVKRRRLSQPSAPSDSTVAHRTEAPSSPEIQPAPESKLSNGPSPAPPVRRPKRRYALFIGYVGEKYHGMQINPDVLTVEQVILAALTKADLVTAKNGASIGNVGWMRSARTDKGVSAALNCASVKLMIPTDGLEAAIAMLNQHLPKDIRAFGLLRATNGFNARQNCHYRRYEYILPISVLGPKPPFGYKGPDMRIERFTKLLSEYEGSHDFANFTEGIEHGSDKARRVMKRVRCHEVITPPGAVGSWVVVEIFGQSFLLHQIRKMIGLALTVHHGHLPPEAIKTALRSKTRVSTPMAPALGLLLDSLSFDLYNSRFAKQLGSPISDENFRDAKTSYKTEKIYRNIVDREWRFHTIQEWVEGLATRQLPTRDQIAELHTKFITSTAGESELRLARVASYYRIHTCMRDFAGSDDCETSRQADVVRDAFTRTYGKAPSFIARAPGRVILIGEHLDYNALPVIGVALRQNVIVAGEPLVSVHHVDVSHLEDEKFAPGMLLARDGAIVPPDNRKPTDTGNGNVEQNGKASDTEEGNTSSAPSSDYQWLRYVSGGVKALISRIDKKRSVCGGGRLVFGGDLARAGGLASSSALVTVSTLAAARINRRRFPRTELAHAAAEGERGGVGTQGGCVDHIVSMCSVANSATLVSFVPKLNVSQLLLPKRLRLFVVDSGVAAHKGETSGVRENYNQRATECRVGAALLAQRLGMASAKAVLTPGQLLLQAKKMAMINVENASDLRRVAQSLMNDDEEISPEAARKELNIPLYEFCNRFMRDPSAADEEKGIVRGENLVVGKRMAHVLSEAARVDEMASTFRSNDIGEEQKVRDVGSILTRGQRSLREWLETSCKEVDEVVEVCIAAGAAGARMTGAGWGGFVVCAVLDSSSSGFIDKVKAKVGKNRTILPVEPGAGACVFAIYSAYNQPRGSDAKEQVAKTSASAQPAVCDPSEGEANALNDGISPKVQGLRNGARFSATRNDTTAKAIPNGVPSATPNGGT